MEINPDDFDFDNYSEEEEIAGSSDTIGSALFTWKDKEYEVDITVHEAWDKHGGYDKFIEVDSSKPKEIPEDDWEQIVDWVKEEVGAAK